MPIKYDILRNETTKDENGKTSLVFLQILATKGQNSTLYEHFLDADEISGPFQDVVEECFLAAGDKLQAEIDAVKPVITSAKKSDNKVFENAVIDFDKVKKRVADKKAAEKALEDAKKTVWRSSTD